ncbi:Na+/H+ antiporter NhaA [Olsenella phocaeensis]|uniref:Na+/H+ antiporter NhaA n=1 Tax=Olsenella phocaeensis TaxID=1852385 RepID=UPI0009F8590C|nr:Na+/H+ antiporter NhaA [Olsenella phocaeensis]
MTDKREASGKRHSAAALRRHPGIIREPAVVRRLSRSSSIERITSNGTIAAAVMVAAALLAVAVANSPAYLLVHEFLEAPLVLGLGPVVASMSVEAFVNDFLMAIFFLLVGIHDVVNIPEVKGIPLLAVLNHIDAKGPRTRRIGRLRRSIRNL